MIVAAFFSPYYPDSLRLATATGVLYPAACRIRSKVYRGCYPRQFELSVGSEVAGSLCYASGDEVRRFLQASEMMESFGVHFRSESSVTGHCAARDHASAQYPVTRRII